MELFSVGIDIGGTNTKIIAKNGGKIVNKKTIKTPGENGLEPVLEALHRFCLDNHLAIKKRRGGKKTVFGISTPGIWGVVGGEEMVVGNCFNLPWLLNCPISSRIKDIFGAEAHGLNDAKLQIFGQCAFGGARKSKVAVGLTLGTGVGGAVIIGGKIFLGANGQAGELGHISIDHFRHGARVCNCGNVGCLEAYAGTSGFLKTFKELTQILGRGDLKASEENNIKKIFSLAREKAADNRACRMAVKETSEYIARGLSGLLLSFNPDALIFDGQISRDLDLFWPFVKEELDKIVSQKQVLEKLKIVSSVDPEYSGAIGAAAYAEAIEKGEQVIMSSW